MRRLVLGIDFVGNSYQNSYFMGKRKKRPKGELELELGDQLELLRHACQSYDKGLEAIAKHIALSIRVLVHQHGKSQALLEQLGYDKIRFLDSAGPLNPMNVLSEHKLVSIRVSASGGRYIPIYNGPITLRPVTFGMTQSLRIKLGLNFPAETLS